MKSILMKSIFKWCTAKNLFKYFRRRYSDDQIASLNSIVKLRGKIRTMRWNRAFLERCIKRKVVPSFMKHRLDKSKVKPSWKIQLAFLNEEIEDIYRRLTKLKSIHQDIWSERTQLLTFFDRFRFGKYLAEVELAMEEKNIKLHDKRIEFLVKKRYGNLNSNSDTDAVVNLSNYKPNEDESFALKLGLNFCVAPHTIIREQIAAEIEILYAQVTRKLEPVSEIKPKELKAKLHDITYAYSGSTVDKQDLPLLKSYHTAARSLRNNKDIFITKPDKGTGTVIVDRSAYFSRIETEILSDSTKFTRVGPVDIVEASEKAEKFLRKKLDGLYKSKKIDNILRDIIRPLGSQVPRLYGLPKIHKDQCPYRPILSMVNASQEPLAKWLLKVLEPAVVFYTKFCVKDSFSFAREIRSFANHSAERFMVSYDVCSLFTNVPVREAIEIATNYIYSIGPECRPPTSKETFEELLLLATTEVEFMFGENLYKQIDGVAMGSPLGPALANIFLGFYEEKLFAHTKPPLYYRRYVDDTFVLFETMDQATNFHAELNQLHPAIQFTMETECDLKLPFLDVHVDRTSGKFVTAVYRKKTFTGQYMKWHSFAPSKRKLNLIHTLVLRAKSICSPSVLDGELKTIKKIVLSNGYPEYIVNAEMRRAVEKFDQPPTYGPKLCPVYLKLPWIGEKSSLYERQIQRSVKSCYGGGATLRVSYTTKPLLKFSLKTPTPTLSRSKVIYGFKCLCGKRYVGRTEQRLADRIKQHVPSTIRNKNSKRKQPDAQKQSSAIGKHLCENRSCADKYCEDWFTVLDTARSSFHLATLEAAYISATNPILCRQKSFVYALQVCKGL